MTVAIRKAVVPSYLVMCLLLGGSTEGVWTNLILELCAVAMIAVSISTVSSVRLGRLARRLLALAFALVLLVILQLVPLPPGLWTSLPGRAFVVDGFALLDQPLPWMSLSLDPAATLTSACYLLPPLAIVMWLMRIGPPPLRLTVGAILAVGLAGAVLGLRQIASGDPSLYFYRFASWGKAPGFFANSTHMAVLMLCSLPFLAALVIDLDDPRRNAARDGSRRAGLVLAAAAIGLVLLALIAINSSGAVLLLSAPVLFLTVALWGGRGVSWLRRLAVPIVLVTLVGAVALTYFSGRTQVANQVSVATRSVIWSHGGEALRQFGTVGSGIGSFREIYTRFEPATTIERTYVNHAHNDYLEIAIEAGVPGILLTILFLSWWCGAAWAAWRGANENVYARAATIVSGALLIHETVEYPLRSPGLAALFALSVGLMAIAPLLPVKKREGELWASRHLVMD